MIGVPVHVGGSTVGSLDVYRDRRYAWSAAENEALMEVNVFVEQLVSSALVADRHDVIVWQLQAALDTRVVIERAVGFVMHAEDLSAVDAFHLLRNAARTRRRRVFDVAQEVLEECRLVA